MPVNEKKELRKSARALRDSFNEEYINHASKLACELLSTSKEFKLADTILIYYPIKNEISPLPLIKIAKAQGKSIALPICDTESGTLLFKKVSRINDLKQTYFGLIEPTVDLADASITPNTICIVPALLFSRKGHRLGYGKGYYDRFLKSFSGKSIGFSYSALLYDDIPFEEHDIPLDIIISESEVLYIDQNIT